MKFFAIPTPLIVLWRLELLSPNLLKKFNILFNNMKIIYNDDYFLQAVKQHTSKFIFKHVSDQELINKVTNLIRVEYENEFKESAA